MPCNPHHPAASLNILPIAGSCLRRFAYRVAGFRFGDPLLMSCSRRVSQYPAMTFAGRCRMVPLLFGACVAAVFYFILSMCIALNTLRCAARHRSSGTVCTACSWSVHWCCN